MTAEREAAMEANNAADADAINAHHAEAAEYYGAPAEEASVELFDVSAEASEGFGEFAGEFLSDALAPISAAFIAGRAVSKHCKTDEQKLAYGSLAAGGAALFACTPVGGALLGMYAGGRLLWTGAKFLGLVDTKIQPVNVQVHPPRRLPRAAG